MNCSRFLSNSGSLGCSKMVRGFSLVELSVVLVVMAIIVGAVSTASDLIRQAAGQRIFTDFISPWKSAYVAYINRTGRVPKDEGPVPTGKINGAVDSELCNDGSLTLTNVMLANSVEIPPGNGVKKEDLYVYQDSNGSPHDLKICLMTVKWSVPGKSAGTFAEVDRHVMRLRGLTVELALQLDALVDGASDARFGKFRRVELAKSQSPGGVEWPAVRDEVGEDNLGEIEAYLLLN